MTISAPDAVEVTFRRITPTDDLVYFIRRSCRRFDSSLGEHADWRVVLHRGTRCVRVHVMRNHAGQQATAAVADVEPFLALTHAFGRLAEQLACRGSEPDPCESGVYDSFSPDELSSDAQDG